MSNELIIGASGFVGRHLAKHLALTGQTVYGFDRFSSDHVQGKIQGDLFDQKLLAHTLAEIQPQVIYHLAGILKSNQPDEFYRVHVSGTVALCEAIIEVGIRPLLVFASSSAVYGPGLGAKPITEGFKPRPVTHYAVSKLAQEMVAFRYQRVYNLPVIGLRMFNLIGPGLSADMACSAFARQIALAEKNGGDSIATGDLSARRDFVDVRDAVRAFQMIAVHGQSGQVYNVCSGWAISIRECLDILLRLTPRPLQVVHDQARQQDNDVPVQMGSAERIRRQSGWQTQIPMQASLSDLLDDWRQKVKSEAK
jgi:GDP-4-dehydro-6-deoxy-D-mannose reductase